MIVGAQLDAPVSVLIRVHLGRVKSRPYGLNEPCLVEAVVADALRVTGSAADDDVIE